LTQLCTVLPVAAHCVPPVHWTQLPFEQSGVVFAQVVWSCQWLLTQLCTVLPVGAHRVPDMHSTHAPL